MLRIPIAATRAASIGIGIALAIGTTVARANSFSVTPNISGGFGQYRWDIAIDGGAASGNPDLTLYTGQQYTFNVSTSSIHPFWIKTAPSTGPGNAYAGTGLSANGVAMPSTITFDVPIDAPTTLYYNCGNHAEMTGVITVIHDLIFRDGFGP